MAGLIENPVRYGLQMSPLWALAYLAIAALGIAAQVVSTRRWEIDTTNRLSQMMAEPTRADAPVQVLPPQEPPQALAS
jgi:hypothetical protein